MITEAFTDRCTVKKPITKQHLPMSLFGAYTCRPLHLQLMCHPPLWPSATHITLSSCTAILLGLPEPEDEGTTVLPNVWNHLPNNTASHPRQNESSTTLWEPPISYWQHFYRKQKQTNKNKIRNQKYMWVAQTDSSALITILKLSVLT